MCRIPDLVDLHFFQKKRSRYIRRRRRRMKREEADRFVRGRIKKEKNDERRRRRRRRRRTRERELKKMPRPSDARASTSTFFCVSIIKISIPPTEELTKGLSGESKKESKGRAQKKYLGLLIAPFQRRLVARLLSSCTSPLFSHPSTCTTRVFVLEVSGRDTGDRRRRRSGKHSFSSKSERRFDGGKGEN